MIAPVAADAEEIIAAAADDALRGLLPTVTAEPHRLSIAALTERVEALGGKPVDEMRAGLQAIANELELHRWGYDNGFEDGDAAGYDRAINDAIDNPDAFADRLQEIRGTRQRWTDTGTIGYDEDQP
ncbi:hypothetical protein OHB24_27115 [Kribbella sp. NBC_00482]|uniref:hypothetical protein n=1 Tax=Kribbella sp. NBC_00482 TaxID=2975968 RepID=UPI002E176CEE